MRRADQAIAVIALIGLGLLLWATALDYGPLYLSSGIFWGTALTLWLILNDVRRGRRD